MELFDWRIRSVVRCRYCVREYSTESPSVLARSLKYLRISTTYLTLMLLFILILLIFNNILE